MQEPHSHVTSSDETKHAPLHNDIEQCARELWVQYGKPDDRDLEIWLEAEQKLFSATVTARGRNAGAATMPVQRQAKPSRH